MTEAPKKKRPYRTCAHALKTVQHVGIELARTYRRMKRGDIDTQDGYRMAAVLNILRQCLETAALEQRLAELEAQVGRGNPVLPWKPKMIS